MSKENKTMYALLGMISHSPMSGYDIKKRVESSIAHFWDISYGQIYPLLKKMLHDGFVTMTIKKQTDIPDKKIYKITKQGLTALEKWVASPVEKETVRFEILLKLFFGRHNSTKNILEHLEQFQARSNRDMKKFHDYEKNLKDISIDDDDHFYFMLTAMFGKYFRKASLEWSDEVIRLIKKRERKNNV